MALAGTPAAVSASAIACARSTASVIAAGDGSEASPNPPASTLALPRPPATASSAFTVPGFRIADRGANAMETGALSTRTGAGATTGGGTTTWCGAGVDGTSSPGTSGAGGAPPGRVKPAKAAGSACVAGTAGGVGDSLWVTT